MDAMKQRLLPPFLVVAGLTSLSAFPLSLVWPSGWAWGMEGVHYFHMIVSIYAVLGVFLLLAARNPGEYRSLLLFTAWSSAAHGGLMAGQAVQMHEMGHLLGDVPILLGLAFGLMLLMPPKTAASS